MPIINGCLSLKPNAPFEEIEKQWYINLFECVPPLRWSSPFMNFGWFLNGEPHSHDFETGEAYHYLCFFYNGRYFAGCRSTRRSYFDYEKEIKEFCKNIDRNKYDDYNI